MAKFTTWLKKFARGTLINLGTAAISLPTLAICLLLTFSAAFWVNGWLIENNYFGYLSGRVMLLLILPGCLGTFLLNGLIIYRVYRFLEARFGEPK